MPDNDRFRWGLSARWMRVHRSISAGDGSDQIADFVVKAVAADLRRSGGIEAAAERAEAVEWRPDSVRWSDPIQDQDSVSSRHQLTLLAVDQLTRQLALTSPVTALEALAERVISNMTDDKFDRMLPDVLRLGSLTAAEFADLRDVVHGHPQMALLRDQLVKHPSAAGLQAPRRTVRPPKVADLLNTDLGDL
ncbi:hypothetical protein [Propionicicella superfundia]|uniref:hypothetical protein n=1 Tax=Propionicicella superfundia TaxID=348582 RepID=UPI000490B6B2|nr:hypothetical protein [Propionicicella superfundia]